MSSRRNVILVQAGAVLLGLGLILGTCHAARSEEPAVKPAPEEMSPSRPSVLETLEIKGEIDEGMAEKIAKSVRDINDNRQIKGVLLTVNTPGGGAIASSAINEELSKLKVPVVAWCDAECASGGMYVLMNKSVKFIAVRRETVAGSIGVISTATRYNRLLDWAKVDSAVYKSAPLKDAGNPARPETEADRAYLQSIVDELAQRFYDLVKDARGDKITDWDAVKSARIFFGQDAVKVGLADGVLSYEAAEKKAKELSGAAAIYTRDEMKAMAKIAGGDAGYSYHERAPDLVGEMSARVDGLLQQLHRMEMGQTVRFEYLAPFQF